MLRALSGVKLWCKVGMAIEAMNKNAAGFEASGVGGRGAPSSERRGVGDGRWFGVDHAVFGAVVVVAMDLIAVPGLEQVEEVVDEVVDLNDGIVAEPGQRDVGGGRVVVVGLHVDALSLISAAPPHVEALAPRAERVNDFATPGDINLGQR